MSSYSGTTLLPSSPPFSSVDEVIISLCDEALRINYTVGIPENDKMLMFDFTMALVDFWERVRTEEERCTQQKET